MSHRASLVALLLSFSLAACGGTNGDAADAVGADATGAVDAGAGDGATQDGLPGADVPAPPADAPANPDDAGGPGDTGGGPPPEGPTVRFDREGADFYDSPFPSLLRTTESGAPDWSNVPNPNRVPIIGTYATTVMALADGAGCNGAVYFGFSGPLDESTLPSPAESVDPSANVQLIDVDPDSPERGRRIPVHVHQVTEARGGFFTPPVMTIQPVFGMPLRGGTLYAAVLLRSVRGANGGPLRQEPTVVAALAGTADDEAQAAFAPLVAALPDLGFTADRVAAATVFRTFEPTRELRAIRDFVWADADVPDVLEIAEVSDREGFTIYEGRFRSRNFQQGQPPYATEGGFAWGEDGAPLSRREDLTFSLVVPDEPVETTPGRTPMVIYSHGTFGDHKTCYESNPAQNLAAVGLPTICINQPLHGDRWSGSSGDQGLLELYSFNFLNPSSGVTTFRQAALDNVLVAKLLREGAPFTLPGDHAVRTLAVDPDQLYFFGHSQGGIVGALFFGVEPDVRGGVLSGAGGVLIQTILHRTDPTDLRQLVATTARISDLDTLTTDHPLLVLIQNATDLTDPINYARQINVPGNRKHVMMTAGTADADTPPQASEPLATALRLPILDPIAQLPEGHPLLGLSDPITPPVTATLDVGDGTFATAFLAQYGNWGHFVVFQNADARALYRSLFASMIEREVPVVAP